MLAPHVILKPEVFILGDPQQADMSHVQPSTLNSESLKMCVLKLCRIPYSNLSNIKRLGVQWLGVHGRPLENHCPKSASKMKPSSLSMSPHTALQEPSLSVLAKPEPTIGETSHLLAKQRRQDKQLATWETVPVEVFCTFFLIHLAFLLPRAEN